MDLHHKLSRILIVDSYDSFTNNLAALVKRVIPSSVIYIIKNDELQFDCLVQYLAYFHAIFVGPGPGSPHNLSDVGVVKHLWHLPDDAILPIFGVCLGLQSLAIEYGATLERLNVVKHGQVSRIAHTSDDIYDGIPIGASVVRYHSLHVTISTMSKLEALAWADDGNENGTVVMALKHRFKPFWAVQYHPESVCTDDSGLRVLENFWHLASKWRRDRHLETRPWNDTLQKQFVTNSWPPLLLSATPGSTTDQQRVTTSTISLPQLSVSQICDILGVYKSTTDFLLLESVAQPGRHTIIGCIHPSTPKLQYFVGDASVTLIQGNRRTSFALGSSDIWSWLASFMLTKEAMGGNPCIPFWGGLVGSLSYELSVETLDCGLDRQSNKRRRFPDVNMVFVDRSLVIDSKADEVHLQSLIPDDDEWFGHMSSTLKRAACETEKISNSATLQQEPAAGERLIVTPPDKEHYIKRVRETQEFLFSGESYELCLTAQTRIQVPKASSSSSQASWELYKRLRSTNPAPYAAYVRLHPMTLISSSPERFLSYSRPPSQRFQLRPIKGTVKKGAGMTRDCAEEVLSSPKEIGENLMIVDLIRHDLHGVVGPNVVVKKFCGIEEYETLWQLVSVIEGEPSILAESGTVVGPIERQLGWELLKKSLPPGSMTGAPKKRSVQILRGLEEDERGVYSGVIGYWCAGGGGDWSVVIRSCFKLENDPLRNVSTESSVQDDGDQVGNYDDWYVGAGGAITALSNPEAEYEEMVVKLQCVLRAFGAHG